MGGKILSVVKVKSLTYVLWRDAPVVSIIVVMTFFAGSALVSVPLVKLMHKININSGHALLSGVLGLLLWAISAGLAKHYDNKAKLLYKRYLQTLPIDILIEAATAQELGKEPIDGKSSLECVREFLDENSPGWNVRARG